MQLFIILLSSNLIDLFYFSENHYLTNSMLTISYYIFIRNSQRLKYIYNIAENYGMWHKLIYLSMILA